MPELKLKQLQYEIDTCKHLLVFMMDQNIHQKNRLSEILKNGFDINLLEEMENFQTNFIKEDERIRLLRNEVVEVDKLLKKDIFEDGQIIQAIDTRVNNLRRNINHFEQEFCILKSDFNSYLLANM